MGLLDKTDLGRILCVFMQNRLNLKKQPLCLNTPPPMKQTCVFFFLLCFCMQAAQAQDAKARILFGNGDMERYTNFSRNEYMYVITKSLQDKFVVVDDADAFDFYIKEGDTEPIARHTSSASTNALLRYGRLTQCDKAFSMNALFFSEYIVITIKVVDVTSGALEKTYVKEFLNLPNDFNTIMEVALKDCFGIEADAKQTETVTKYTYKTTPASTYRPLRLSGPRIGLTYLTPGMYSWAKKPRFDGGYGLNYPMLLQFGYQFEQQFTSSGRLQVLSEIVPMITGFDQNMFTFSLLTALGFRDNKTGLEFGIGPSFSLRREARGFYDENDNWTLAPFATSDEQRSRLEYSPDSRGDIRFHTQAVLVLGYSFRSGRINIPVNIYAVPGKDWRYGLLVGFNIRRDKGRRR